MNHFKGVSVNERYDNELLNEIRKTNQLLEQILNKEPQRIVGDGVTDDTAAIQPAIKNAPEEAQSNVTSNSGTSINSSSKGQPGQRRGNGNSGSRKQ